MASRSWSKWHKHQTLIKSAKLKPHLPATSLFSKTSFWRLLNQYDQVIVKPTNSSGGKGVIRISKKGRRQYEVHNGSKKRKIQGKDKVYAYVKKGRKQNHLVQQRIPLATVDKRPFDLRVMVQRRVHSKWKVTGKLAKVAGKGYIITNTRRSHGMILPIKKAIKRSSIHKKSTRKLKRHINKVALLTAKQIKKKYPSARTLGIDMGLDRSGKPWIIEVNFTPMKSLFLKLKNKSIYRRILSYV
ncbi:Endospore coat-associated protein YheD [compost metagenome]